VPDNHFGEIGDTKIFVCCCRLLEENKKNSHNFPQRVDINHRVTLVGGNTPLLHHFTLRFPTSGNLKSRIVAIRQQQCEQQWTVARVLQFDRRDVCYNTEESITRLWSVPTMTMQEGSFPSLEALPRCVDASLTLTLVW
jgi:hypothetical protein